MEHGMVIVGVISALLLAIRSWGPGTHILLADRLLDSLDDLDSVECENRDLLRAYPDSYRYGCIAADIINLKKYGGLDNHCHNWNIKERLEANVETEQERAFVLGYLSHLAADVVAHNHFVPYQVVYRIPPIVLGHTYWEVRADGRIEEEKWTVIDGLRTHDELHENDELVRHAVPTRALSMRTNKFIFNHVVLARSKQSWRELMDRMRRDRPTGHLDEPFVDACLERCFEYMVRTLDPEGLASLRELDPNGHAALAHTRQIRRDLRVAHRDRAARREASIERARELYGLE